MCMKKFATVVIGKDLCWSHAYIPTKIKQLQRTFPLQGIKCLDVNIYKSGTVWHVQLSANQMLRSNSGLPWAFHMIVSRRTSWVIKLFSIHHQNWQFFVLGPLQLFLPHGIDLHDAIRNVMIIQKCCTRQYETA